MPSKELTKVASEPAGDWAIQVETTLPVRPRRHESRIGGQPDSASDVGSRSRIPRITRLMALAIKFQDMVDRREVRDYAEIARLGYVTRARLTQIMNLILLAPNIQEDLLGLDGRSNRKFDVSERHLRSLSKIDLWQHQERVWARMKTETVAVQSIPHH